MAEQVTVTDSVNKALDLNQDNDVESYDYEMTKSVIHQEPRFDYTESGNAELMVDTVGDKVAWVNEIDLFAIHDERWKLDNDGAIVRFSKLLLQRRKQELAYYRRVEKRLNSLGSEYNTEQLKKVLSQRIKQLVSHCTKMQSKASIFAIRDLFKTEKGITLSLATFDSKPHFVGAKNGIVDLRTGDFITNEPEYLMMKSLAVSYDPEKDCPKFKKFIAEVMLGHPEVISFMKRLAGQMILGITNKDKFVILIGDGLNGKSVFIDIMVNLLGDYAEQTDADVFTENRGNKDYFKAELVGKRLVAMNESSRGDKLDSSMVKSCVRSGKIVARSPYMKPITYQPMFTPVLSTNNLPYIEQDQAVWERLLIIPFDYVVPKDKRDGKLKENLLKEEAQGILNWMIEGAQDFLDQGLNIPDVIVQKQAEYRLKSDRVSQFLSDCCGESISIKESLPLRAGFNEIFSGYKIWCSFNNYLALGSGGLKDELKKKGFKIGQNNESKIVVHQIEIIDFGNTISLKLHDSTVTQVMEM
jgi:putative DNA primase/helicase